MDIIAKISEELQIRPRQTQAAVELIDEGCTIPFIARYRKEATGALNDEVLRALSERLGYLRNLEERKETVLAGIEEQGKLTEELRAQILAAETMVAVEDLYRPYRPKRRTRATIAKERGLEPLAAMISLQMIRTPLAEEAEKYVNAECGVGSAQDAVSGAKDILAEAVSDEAAYRTKIRDMTVKEGRLLVTAKDPEAESVYEMYYAFDEPVAKLAGHRILAINRGENEKFLSVKIEAPVEEILRYLEKRVIVKDNPETASVLKEVVADAYDRMTAMKSFEEPTSEVKALRALLADPEIYDPVVVQALINGINVLYPGVCVELTGHEKGLVIIENEMDIFRPWVLSFRDNKLYDLSNPSSCEGLELVDIMKTMDNRIKLDPDLLKEYEPCT